MLKQSNYPDKNFNEIQGLINDEFFNTNMNGLQIQYKQPELITAANTFQDKNKLVYLVNIVLQKIEQSISSIGAQLKQIIIKIKVNKNTYFAHSDDVKIYVFAKSEESALNDFIELFKNPKYNKT